jgi:methylmalonyl-CoA/ethylmalonyl-CoA epimerase
MDLTLHHIGIVVADVARASDQYVRRFGYKVSSDIIHDANQTAYIRFLRLPGDAFHLELVAPDGPESRLANALKKGGGPHHLCYATADIEATWREMREQGMVLLQAPVPAVAFGGRRIAWLMGRDRMAIELVERGSRGEL